MVRELVIFKFFCLYCWSQVLYSKEVVVRTVPQVKGLSSKNLFKFLIEELDGKEYLPDSYADYMPNRVWMDNLCLILQHYFLIGNSLNGDKFHVFIQEKLGKREQEILKNKKYTMNMISSFSDIFDHSQMISGEFSIVFQWFSQKGRSNHLLRQVITKRKSAEGWRKRRKRMSSWTPSQDCMKRLRI